MVRWGGRDVRHQSDVLRSPNVGVEPRLGKSFLLLRTSAGLSPFCKEYDGGFFTAWLTESWRNVSGLFVPLPLIVAGISLYTSYQESKEGDHSRTAIPIATSVFILVVRFILWPIFSIGFIYLIVYLI
jgi:hypothetical protein